MVELTAKERYMRLFRGEPIDRIPVCPRVYENVVFEFFNSKDIPYLESIVEYYRQFDMDIIDWNCTAPPHEHFEFTDFVLEGLNWQPHVKEERDGKTINEIAIVKTPKGELQRILSVTQIGKWEVERAITDFPIKTKRDFEIVAEYMPPEPKINTSGIKKMIELIGNDGIVSPALSGPFNILAYCYRKLDDLLMDATLNPDFFHQMMEYFTNRLCKVAQYWIDTGAHLIDIAANMANSRVVSADFLVEHILPYENRLADFIQNQGVAALYHNCGFAAKHLDVYNKLHHRIWGYLSPAPHGDTTIEEAIAKLPREMILWGHVDQIDFLRKATPKEIEERVKYICETIKPRGNYILGTSDYLEVNTPHENIRAFIEAGRKYGRYD